jgi:hypothetical protein
MNPLSTDPVRTSINPSDPDRTISVRRVRVFPVTVFTALLAAALGCPSSFAGPGASLGLEERQQAAGWLQLRQDQKTYREGLGSLTPGQAAALDALDRQQQLQWRAMEQRQEQSLQLRQGLDHLPGPRAGSGAGEIRLRREQERERLNMRLQRGMLAPPVPPPMPPAPTPGGTLGRPPPGFGPGSGIIH